MGVELRGGGREAWPAGQREKGREKREKRRDAFASCSVCACVFVLCGGARLWSDRIRRAPDATDGQGRTRKRGTYGTCRPAGGGRLRLELPSFLGGTATATQRCVRGSVRRGGLRP